MGAGLIVEFDVSALMDAHRGMVRRGEYIPLGRLAKLMIGADGVANVKDNPLARIRQSVSLDWYGTGPQVALSKDQQDLLVLGPMAKPPDIPDPNWLPPRDWFVPKSEGGLGHSKGPKSPRIEQRLRDRAAGMLTAKDGRRFVLFQPIHQAHIILPKIDRGGGLCLLNCRELAGRHTALLYNAKSGEAFFLFGHKEADFLI